MTDPAAEPYDPSDYPPFAVTVDLVLMTVIEGRLAVLLQQRGQSPFVGLPALPGSFVGPSEKLEQAARRVLADKAGMADGWLEQLYTFGDPGRDPRMRVISIAYSALMPAAHLADATTQRADLKLAPANALLEPLAFDHAAIVELAIARLRSRLDHAPVALALLPEVFTLRDVQHVHEAILGKPVNKPAFRRRLLDTGWIEGTGQREMQTAFRPAEFYRRIKPDSSV
jgi:8-oxo-dGTP diphosphatase